VYIEYASGRAKKKKNDNFNTNPGLFLIRECDWLAKETRIEYKRTKEESIDYFGKVAI